MKNIGFVLLLLSYHVAFAQSLLKIQAPDYKGKYIVFNIDDDLITFTQKQLGKTFIDSSGKCEFTVQTYLPAKVYLEIGNTYGFLYVDANTKEYNIFFPKAESVRQGGNEVELVFENLPKDDLNTLILEFNYRVDDLLFGDSLKLQRLVLQNDEFKKEINDFKVTVIKEYSDVDNDYFHHYIQYTIGDIEQLYIARGMLKNKIYLFETYLNEKPILYRNDAYMTFFTNYFKGFFITNIGLIDKIKFAINNYNSYEKLSEVLDNSPFLKDEKIKELVTILNLYEGFYRDYYDADAIVEVLEQLYKRTEIAEHKKIIKNIFKEFTKLQPGTTAPDFELVTQKKDTIHLSDLKGKYVYLQFFNSQNPVAVQDLNIMQELYKKYKKYIDFVSVGVDEKEKDFDDFIKKNPQIKWKTGYYKGDVNLLRDYNVKSLPHYILINEEGNLIEPNALGPAPVYPRPSIDKTFYFIKKKKEPNYKRVIGSKGN